MTKKQGKASAAKKKKAVKDLDPKGRGKDVRGGRAMSPGDHANRLVNRDVGRTTERVGEAINDAGKTFNRTLNPR